MRMFDINGNRVNVDVRESNYPVKANSRSKLQGIVGKRLNELYPSTPILEDFTVPGCRLSVDFFLPRKGIIVEIHGSQHDQHNSFFHGDKTLTNKFAKQLSNDHRKINWADVNGFTMIEIRTEKDLEQLDG